MDYRLAKRELRQGRIQPIYVCYGTEKYLLDEFIAELTAKLIEPGHQDFALAKLDLTEASLESAIDEAQEPPFIVPRKLIVAKNALFLTGAKDQGKLEHPVDKLQQYMVHPSDFAVLVLTVEAEKLDERKKIVKLLKEKDVLIPFLPMTEEELRQWVARQAEKEQVQLGPGAGEELLLYTGGSLQSVAGEIRKLATFAGPGGTVGAEDVRRLVVPGTEQNVFLLIENIVQLKLERAFAIFYDLLKQKEEPIKILLLIARQFRIILQVKEYGRQGFAPQQIAGYLSLHPYAVKLAAEQGKRYDGARLSSILSQLAELDYKMKTGTMDKVLGLELFLLRLAPEAGR
ncbi:DNA polymerase III subunit delta [Paenibacillus sp. y28]|uniref:DNA polymerase III subunit delta n=1 Tax=Paenibacillus sp. y28 TaxID=3129110 RepID=UPI003016E1F4